MRRLYTYLRTNMSQNRLDNMMVRHVHKEKTDALKLENTGNEFVFGSIHRLKQFWKFTGIDLRGKDIPVKSCGVDVNIQK